MSSVSSILPFLLLTAAQPLHHPHAPIIIQNQPTSPDQPLIIEGYEISNPDGPGIQVRDVNYVIIRNNFLHNCGTNISLKKQRLVQETGDARKAMLDKPFETGAILVFDARGTVEICGNEVRDNDYGIMVQGHRHRANVVSVHGNKVQDNHRSAFIWVGESDRVEIHDNFVQDNGLDVFFDNEGLARAMQEGKDFGDGRTQGILTKDCNHVRIYRNTVINSVSDGIGIMNRGLTFDENRRLQFDADYENRLVYDIFGIGIICSSNNVIRANRIHHNGDGGIGWFDAITVERWPSSNNVIEGNQVHHNRVAALVVRTKALGKTVLKGNEVANNGGNPIHFQFYDDYDMRAHPQDWEYRGTALLFKLLSDEQKGLFEMEDRSMEGGLKQR